MAKPRIRLWIGDLWLCHGRGEAGIGPNPCIAFANWQTCIRHRYLDFSNG